MLVVGFGYFAYANPLFFPKGTNTANSNAANASTTRSYMTPGTGTTTLNGAVNTNGPAGVALKTSDSMCHDRGVAKLRSPLVGSNANRRDGLNATNARMRGSIPAASAQPCQSSRLTSRSRCRKRFSSGVMSL